MKEHKVPCLRQKSISKVRITSTSILREKIHRTSYKISSFLQKTTPRFFIVPLNVTKNNGHPFKEHAYLLRKNYKLLSWH